LAGSETTVERAPGSRYLRFQFEDLEQQRDSATLGMWIFLSTEILFFGALFTAYFIYRGIYPHAFAEASAAMLIKFGTANTFILICSSLTMALGVHAAATGKRRLLVLMLIVTLLLGTAFLVNKGFEYHQEWEEHHLPGPGFSFPESNDPRHAEIFFSLYFIMTGVHTLHMLVGIGVVGTVACFAWRGAYAPENYNTVENVGLYWHFVDIVWVFLYPMLYLVAHRHF
jgi:cytochrome c oxidase subunit 3